MQKISSSKEHKLKHSGNNQSIIKISQKLQLAFTSYQDEINDLFINKISPSQRNTFLKIYRPQIQNNNFAKQYHHAINHSNLSRRNSKLTYQQEKQGQQNASQFIFKSSSNTIKKSTKQCNFINMDDQNMKFQQFSVQQRQSLKNAFRYICRLIFKQADKYFYRINQLQLSRSKSYKQNKNKQISQLNILQQAQLISGERYFKQYIQKLNIQQKIKLLKYMIWFLKFKYLRYINKCNNQNKGKRKQMKKELYLRYKNIIMLPYLQEMLFNIEETLLEDDKQKISTN